MTANMMKTLVCLWRRQLSDHNPVFAEDVAVEIATTLGDSYGTKRAEDQLKKLRTDGYVKRHASEGGYSLANRGAEICEVLSLLGMNREF